MNKDKNIHGISADRRNLRKTKKKWEGEGKGEEGGKGNKKGEGKQERFDTGVGIIINNKYKTYINKIYPYNDRMMAIELNFSIKTIIFSVYAPAAEVRDETKEEFYSEIARYTDKHRRKGPTYLMGDWNARVQIKRDQTENGIGKWTFDKENNKLEGQSEGAADNRQRFIAYSNAMEMKVMNTQFQKEDKKLVTYMEMGVKGGPYERGRYEMIDYILTGERWKNTIKT